MQLLNHRKPEHPPDIYFIRRNPKLLDKYLDPVEMDGLVREAAPRLKVNYNLSYPIAVSSTDLGKGVRDCAAPGQDSYRS